MEEENSVFGTCAENTDNIDTNENFDFYTKNKETAKKDADKAADDFSDFMSSVSEDIYSLTEDEINMGIEKILAKTHPAESKSDSVAKGKSKKVTFKVLFLVALLSIISFSCLFAIGNSHNINIENGFVTFTKDTIKIVFFGESEEEVITLNALLADLEHHGYKDLLFPEEFIVNSGEYKFGIPEYTDGEIKQVSFDVIGEQGTLDFTISKDVGQMHSGDFRNLDNADTLIVGDIIAYVFDFCDNEISVSITYNGYCYSIGTNEIPYSEVVRIVNTIR